MLIQLERDYWHGKNKREVSSAPRIISFQDLSRDNATLAVLETKAGGTLEWDNLLYTPRPAALNLAHARISFRRKVLSFKDNNGQPQTKDLRYSQVVIEDNKTTIVDPIEKGPRKYSWTTFDRGIVVFHNEASVPNHIIGKAAEMATAQRASSGVK